jgi:hypothetical protein
MLHLAVFNYWNLKSPDCTGSSAAKHITSLFVRLRLRLRLRLPVWQTKVVDRNSRQNPDIDLISVDIGAY